MSAQTNCTTPGTMPSAFNPSSTSSFQDFVFALVFSFAPFLNTLPDWLKLAILGTVLETSRRYVTGWYYSAKDAMFLTIVFDSDDQSFQWIMSWIARQPAFNKARQMEVSTRYQNGEGASIIVGDGEIVDEDEKDLKYIPSPAISYSLWYKRRWMEVTRTKTGGANYYDKETDRLTVRILTRNRKIVNALLLEAKRAYSEKTEQSVCVYVNDQMDNWRHVACRAKRPLRSIILDPGVKDLLLEDARDFLASKQWYADRGIPHRRGYLLYGKPGSGKTSLIQAIAGELGLHVYIISLSRAGLDDTTLSSAIGDLPGRCIALMEDIDAAFHRGITREQEEEAPADDESGEASGPSDKPSAPKGPPASRVTLSGLLNALDGVGAQEGRILFATTNRYTALDDALIRPGRLDLHVEFKHASTFQIEELFRTFYQPDIRKTKEEAAKDAAKKTGSKIEEVTVDVISEKKDEVEDVPLIDLDLTSVDVEKPAVAPPTPSSSRSVSPDASPALPTISDLPGVTAAGPILSSATTKSGNVAFGTSHSARAPSLSEAQYDSLTKKFSAQIPSDMFSMAALQGYLMTYKIRPVDAVKDVKAWVEKERADRKKAAKGSQPRKVVEKKEEKEKEAAVVAEPESSS